MTALALAIGAVLAVACVVFVALPFLREPDPVEDRLERLRDDCQLRGVHTVYLSAAMCARQASHHTTHFCTGFIFVPGLHWKTLPNSSLSEMGPFTRPRPGECQYYKDDDQQSSSHSTPPLEDTRLRRRARRGARVNVE